MKHRFLGDADGLTKGHEYEIVGFGDSVAVLVGDDGCFQRHTYGQLNNRDLWEPANADDHKPKKAGATKSKET